MHRRPHRGIALPAVALPLLHACAATLAEDAGGATRLLDLSAFDDPQGAAQQLLQPALDRGDASAARRVAWLGISALDTSRTSRRRLRDAAAAVGPQGLAILLAVGQDSRLPGYSTTEARARRAGWRHVQYWIDAAARHAVHVLERLPQGRAAHVIET